MRSLSCRRCGTVLTWDGSGAVVRCHICGAQYRVHPRGDASRGATVGTGDVAPIRTTQGQFTGIPLVKSFTPKGWKLSTNAPECEMNRLVPLTPSVEYLSPDQGACITYTGTQAQWNAISKGSNWNYNTGSYTIHCTDGDIAK